MSHTPGHSHSAAAWQFRKATAPLGAKAASKWVGDCYLLACATASDAALFTFDRALAEFAGKHGYAAIVPA